MFNIFVEVINSLDILGDRHTNPIPRVTIDMESKIFINNSSFILDQTNLPLILHKAS